MVRFLVVALAAMLTSPLAARPAAAHPVAHDGVVLVRNLRPAFGAVVPAGPVLLAAQVLSDVGIAGHEVTLDGQPVVARREGGDGAHPTVVAEVTVGPGDHVAEVTATDAAGRRGGRAWRFTASALEVARVGGADRAGTAIAASQGRYPSPASAGAVVLARGDDFADGLAGVPLAQAEDAPLLLTAGAGLSVPVRDEIARVTPAGATVFLLGGTAALGDQVAADVRSLGRSPRRVAGADRAGTAAAVAEVLPAGDTAYVVNGGTFPDALSASGPAAAGPSPILLVSNDAVPAATRAALAARGTRRVVVIGGEHAVAAVVAEDLREATGGAVERVSGADRYETAVAVAVRFFTDFSRLALASGEQFADALAGSVHAAGADLPLLLTPGAALPPTLVLHAGAWQPASVVVYGGAGAVAEEVVGDVRGAVLDAGAPAVVSADPAPSSVVSTLDQVVVTFDRELVVEASTLYVTMGGEEVPGRVGTGDFDDTLVFTATELPLEPALGQPVEVRVRGLGYDGRRWRHVDLDLTYRKLDLSLGDEGAPVEALQRRLTELTYWLGPVDGVYGHLTHQAVLAFQKVHGLARDGVVGGRTRKLLEEAAPPAPRSSAGLVVEVDKARQVLLVARDGRTEWAFNTSTGTERPYTYEGRTYVADTPPGRFEIFRHIDGLRVSHLGKLWRPKYFNGGIAIHGSSSVPPYPASHGCVRLTNPAIDFVWANGLMPIGTDVWVY